MKSFAAAAVSNEEVGVYDAGGGIDGLIDRSHRECETDR